MNFNKLVRDKIPEILESKGSKIKTHICDDQEYLTRLRDKLLEEVNEFLEDETVEELADVLEVVYSLAKTKNINKDDLEKIRKEKSEKRGGFDEKIILVEATRVEL